MAHAMTNKTDPVRHVLSTLIEETQSPYTPDTILREFRATADKRLSDGELLFLLESISCKRPNYRELLDEIKIILERKDPMFALLKFTERIYYDNNVSGESAEMPPPSRRPNPMPNPNPNQVLCLLEPMSNHSIGASSSSNSLADELGNGSRLVRKSLDLSTSTPLTSRKPDEIPLTTTFMRRPTSSTTSVSSETMAQLAELSSIKKRVLNAVGQKPSTPALDIVSSNTSRLSARSANGLGTATKSGVSLGAGLTSPSMGLSTTSTCLPDARKDDDNNFNSCDGIYDIYRTNMLWDYCRVEAQPQQQELAALPLESQQQALLSDLLYTLSGVHGSFITPLPRNLNAPGLAKYETHFKVNLQVDKALAEMVYEILPLASHFMGIQQVMATMDSKGQVNNALNAALRDISHDFYLLLSQAEEELERSELTVAKLLYYLQPTIWIMEVIWNVIGEIQVGNLKGAEVLSLLHERIKRMEGDKASQKIMIDLMSKASTPYMRMLQLWIQKGVIMDNTQEFLVVDNEVIHKGELPEHYSDDYWEKRYTIRNDSIPKFLERYSDIILRTGKYLNVIRQCGKRVMSTQQMHLTFDPSNEQHVQVINDAYYFAAHKLLDVLLTENDLMGHLQSVKRYLLLNQGDFTMQFMDACEDELAKNVDQVLPMTLENLLGLTLRLSSARNDPYKDDLHCELLTYDLVTQMSKIMNQQEEYWKTTDRLDLSGLECFAFTYEVNWPVSLVLNHIAITKYQMLFRQLFYCKHVERQLCKIWKENSIAKKFSPLDAQLYRSAFTLRQRMMNAIQNLEYYMMIEVIEPNWHIFIIKMKKVENVDNVLSLHQDFLDLCLKNCMLTETSHLNRAIFKLCKICLKFCEFIQDESLMDETDTFAERVKRFDLEFTGMLISFLKQINDLAKENTSDRFMNLVHRINFNGFYSEQMEKLCVKDAMG
ncbi:gamma-tubulin complex component 2 homolog isoform X2 [Drosophila innubila]|uniref:gamma-tubulin complex component 2 homolog isoform X2 n=1 Tax=Drosophila innubila TaxID=198719 RepID=UPI00148CB2D2|nr:gamma-tubulin complex component 2 homolog isoform X2 [Drosophila innubila]